MNEAAARTGSAISAVMLGAVAGGRRIAIFSFAVRRRQSTASGIALGRQTWPDSPQASMRRSKTLRPGRKKNRRRIPKPTSGKTAGALPRAGSCRTSPRLRMRRRWRAFRRLMDYQDAAYAALYLDRLVAIKIAGWSGIGRSRRETGGARLAVWMSYEDVMRVAQQKVRRSRMKQGACGGQCSAPINCCTSPNTCIHGWQELCETLASAAGAARLLRNVRF